MDRIKAKKIIAICKMEMSDNVTQFRTAGSYRRGEEEIGDIDIVIIPRKGLRLQDCLPPSYDEMNWLGEKKAQIVIMGEKVDIHATTEDSFGAARMYFTGPAHWNIGMRIRARTMGYKLNEYGLFSLETGMWLAGRYERDIFEKLDKLWKAPHRRGERYK